MNIPSWLETSLYILSEFGMGWTPRESEIDLKSTCCSMLRIYFPVVWKFIQARKGQLLWKVSSKFLEGK